MQTRGGLELLPLLFERVHPVAQADLPDAGAEGGDGLRDGDAPPGEHPDDDTDGGGAPCEDGEAPHVCPPMVDPHYGEHDGEAGEEGEADDVVPGLYGLVDDAYQDEEDG